jgi:uroporphyrinogen decarboxylase
LNELKELTNNTVAMLGNIPPRDVLAEGTPEEVIKITNELLDSLEDKSRVIMSCGGGMPPNVSSENIQAFIDTVRNYKFTSLRPSIN